MDSGSRRRDNTPGWFSEIVRIMQDADDDLHVIEMELQRVLVLEGLDSRLCTELRYLRDLVGAVKAGLSQTDQSARQALAEATRGSARLN
jgi:hypothetical protein